MVTLMQVRQRYADHDKLQVQGCIVCRISCHDMVACVCMRAFCHKDAVSCTKGHVAHTFSAAEWIESMNTVMDDNKMLTLASNERIPLTPTMRLLLEINHMNHCSPATVSRGGVIFVNAEDVGWKPMVDSWIEKLEVRLQGLA